MLFLLFSYRCSGIHKSGSPHTPQGFAKKILHPSGYTITDCDIIYYGMRDVSGMFQASFSFLSLRKAVKSSQPNDFNLRRTIFRSAPNEMKRG